jgi:hypothetical protein
LALLAALHLLLQKPQLYLPPYSRGKTLHVKDVALFAPAFFAADFAAFASLNNCCSFHATIAIAFFATAIAFFAPTFYATDIAFFATVGMC